MGPALGWVDSCSSSSSTESASRPPIPLPLSGSKAIQLKFVDDATKAASINLRKSLEPDQNERPLIQNDLEWESQIDYITKKASKTIWRLRRMKQLGMDETTLTDFWKSEGRVHLEVSRPHQSPKEGSCSNNTKRISQGLWRSQAWNVTSKTKYDLKEVCWKDCKEVNTSGYFYRTRVRSLAMLVTHWLTDSLTNWLPFSKLDWCDPGVWRCQQKTCWVCYCCWCWWWRRGKWKLSHKSYIWPPAASKKMRWDI